METCYVINKFFKVLFCFLKKIKDNLFNDVVYVCVCVCE